MTTEHTAPASPIHEYGSDEMEGGNGKGIVAEIDEAFMIHTDSTLALQIYAAFRSEKESELVATLLEMSLDFLSAPCNIEERNKVREAFENDDLESAELYMPPPGRVALSKIARTLGLGGQRAAFILQMWAKKLQSVKIDRTTTNRNDSKSRDADDEVDDKKRESDTDI